MGRTCSRVSPTGGENYPHPHHHGDNDDDDDDDDDNNNDDDNVIDAQRARPALLGQVGDLQPSQSS